MWSTLKTLQCSHTIVLKLHFYQGLQIVLVSKALWLLGLLQLLDAPEVTLTTSAFSWVLWKVSCLATAHPVRAEWGERPTLSTGQQPWERARERPLWLGPRHIDLSYSEKEASLSEGPGSSWARVVHSSNIYCMPVSWKAPACALVHWILPASPWRKYYYFREVK